MRFFADTASLSELEYCFEHGVNDGITTNPKIMEMAGVTNFLSACKGILSRYPNVPVSLETDLRGININLLDENPQKVRGVLLGQAYALSNLGDNVVVKIPYCKGGLLAAEELARQGIKTNVTATVTPYQALRAAEAGAHFVNLFVNRALDSLVLELAGHDKREVLTNPNWKEVVANNRATHLNHAWEIVQEHLAYIAQQVEGTGSSLIAASIRSPDDIEKIARTQPQIITIPYKIVQGLGSREHILALKNHKREITPSRVLGAGSYHPTTELTIQDFENAADKSYRKP